MSSTNFGSILIFETALLVLVIYNVSECFLNGRGPILTSIYINIYIFSTIMSGFGFFRTAPACVACGLERWSEKHMVRGRYGSYGTHVLR